MARDESSPSPSKPALSKLERFGLTALRKTTASSAHTDPIEILSTEEQAELRRLERGAIWRAALAGALSASSTTIAGFFAPDENLDVVGYWLIIGSTTAVASVVEIAFLYADALRTVRGMAVAVGLRADDGRLDDEVALALARAALELPTPNSSVLGVDANQEASRAYLLVASLLYKLKVTVTNFVLKALVRRALGRAATRAALDAVAIPVTALWNAWVTFRVVREARLRLVGSSAAVELERWIAVHPEALDMALRAIACVVVRSRAVHPNVEVLAKRFVDLRLREEPNAPPLPEDVGQARALLDRLSRAPQHVQASTLRAAVAASVIDGRLSQRERQLLSDLYSATGRPVPWSAVQHVRKHLTEGDGLRPEFLDGLV